MSDTVLLHLSAKSALAAQIAELQNLLPRVWSRESSAFPDEWTALNPSVGQCYPTALLFRRMFGGEIIRQTLKFGEQEFYTHFVNSLNGARYDLTAAQLIEASFTVDSERMHTSDDEQQLLRLPWVPRMLEAFDSVYDTVTK